MWAWSAEKNGIYSVKSAYRLISLSMRMLEHNKTNNANSSVSEDNPFWKRIWKLAIPPKVKVFWWRVMHNFVPVKAHLMERHIENQGTCPDCGAQMKLFIML